MLLILISLISAFHPLSTKQIGFTTAEIALDKASSAHQNKEQEMQLAMERWTLGKVRRLREYKFLAFGRTP